MEGQGGHMLAWGTCRGAAIQAHAVATNLYDNDEKFKK